MGSETNSDPDAPARRMSIFDVGSLWLAHAALWAVVVFGLLMVPWFEGVFRDVDINLPWLTQAVIELPRGLFLVFIFIVLALDLALLLVLNRRGWWTILAVLWSLCMVVAPLACALILAFTLWLPLEKIRHLPEARPEIDWEIDRPEGGQK